MFRGKGLCRDFFFQFHLEVLLVVPRSMLFRVSSSLHQFVGFHAYFVMVVSDKSGTKKSSTKLRLLAVNRLRLLGPFDIVLCSAALLLSSALSTTSAQDVPDNRVAPRPENASIATPSSQTENVDDSPFALALHRGSSAISRAISGEDGSLCFDKEFTYQRCCEHPVQARPAGSTSETRPQSPVPVEEQASDEQQDSCFNSDAARRACCSIHQRSLAVHDWPAHLGNAVITLVEALFIAKSTKRTLLIPLEENIFEETVSDLAQLYDEETSSGGDRDGNGEDELVHELRDHVGHQVGEAAPSTSLRFRFGSAFFQLQCPFLSMTDVGGGGREGPLGAALPTEGEEALRSRLGVYYLGLFHSAGMRTLVEAGQAGELAYLEDVLAAAGEKTGPREGEPNAHALEDLELHYVQIGDRHVARARLPLAAVGEDHVRQLDPAWGSERRGLLEGGALEGRSSLLDNMDHDVEQHSSIVRRILQSPRARQIFVPRLLETMSWHEKNRPSKDFRDPADVLAALLATASRDQISDLLDFLLRGVPPGRKLLARLVQPFLGDREQDFPRSSVRSFSSQHNRVALSSAAASQRPLLNDFLQAAFSQNQKCLFLRQVFHSVDWENEDYFFDHFFHRFFWKNLFEKRILVPGLFGGEGGDALFSRRAGWLLRWLRGGEKTAVILAVHMRMAFGIQPVEDVLEELEQVALTRTGGTVQEQQQGQESLVQQQPPSAVDVDVYIACDNPSAAPPAPEECGVCVGNPPGCPHGTCLSSWLLVENPACSQT